MRRPSAIARRKYQKPNQHRNKITGIDLKNFPQAIRAARPVNQHFHDGEVPWKQRFNSDEPHFTSQNR